VSNRVRLWLGAEDGLVSHCLNGPLDRFEAWVSSEAADPPHGPESILAIVQDARRQGIAPFARRTWLGQRESIGRSASTTASFVTEASLRS
jgi:hypothetical protein